MNQLFGLQHRRSENESIFEIYLKDRKFFWDFQNFPDLFSFFASGWFMTRTSPRDTAEYNAYLLYEHGLKNEDDVILEILKGLSAEERKRIIKAASKLKS